MHAAGEWLLRNFRIGPGTIYTPPMPFAVDELVNLVNLGLNTFSVFTAKSNFTHTKKLAAQSEAYVDELRKRKVLGNPFLCLFHSNHSLCISKKDTKREMFSLRLPYPRREKKEIDRYSL